MAESAAQTAHRILTSLGLSSEAATGVIGNLMAESNLNPTGPAGDGGKAKGIAQWHPDRYNAMRHWAFSHGYNPDTLEGQLRYVAYEAGTAAGGNVWDDLKKSTSVGEAAALFMRRFERPANQSDANARSRAQRGIDALDGKGVIGSIGDAIGGAGDAIGGAIDSLPGVSQAKDIGSAIAWISNGHNMLRVVYVVGGSAMILVGLSLIARPVTQPIATAVATRGMSLAK